MRIFQGLLFIGLAIFAIKWEFVAPGAQHNQVVLKPLPPMQAWMHFLQAGILASIGAFLTLTGEWAYWRRQSERFSADTFLSASAAFLAVFLLKFSYASRLLDPEGWYPAVSGYYPPFNEASLLIAYVFLSALAAYYLIRGEFAFWNWKEISVPLNAHSREPSSQTIDSVP